jgi:hypothetical protein
LNLGITLKDQEQRLLAYLRQLSQQDAHSLLRFAAFLAGDQTAVDVVIASPAADSEKPSPAEIAEPQFVERPDNERVVDALKRLSGVYPMLEKKKLLDKASTLVAQHVMFAKPAKDVIDEIEKLFAEAYDKFVSEQRNR